MLWPQGQLAPQSDLRPLPRISRTLLEPADWNPRRADGSEGAPLAPIDLTIRGRRSTTCAHYLLSIV